MQRTLALLLLVLPACGEPTRGKPLPTTATKDVVADTNTADTGGDVDHDGDDVPEVEDPALSFADDGIHDVLVATCTAAGCHGSGAGGFSIIDDVDADYEATFARVTPGDGVGSKLVKKASNVSSHTGGPILAEGSPEYELVVAWIDDGAAP